MYFWRSNNSPIVKCRDEKNKKSAGRPFFCFCALNGRYNLYGISHYKNAPTMFDALLLRTSTASKAVCSGMRYNIGRAPQARLCVVECVTIEDDRTASKTVCSGMRYNGGRATQARLCVVECVTIEDEHRK